jgi:hypothetical protein
MESLKRRRSLEGEGERCAPCIRVERGYVSAGLRGVGEWARRGIGALGRVRCVHPVVAFSHAISGQNVIICSATAPHPYPTPPRDTEDEQPAVPEESMESNRMRGSGVYFFLRTLSREKKLYPMIHGRYLLVCLW